MRTYLDCIPCFVRQALDAARQVSDDEALILRVLRRVLREIAAFPMDLSPPEMAQRTHRIIREETGEPDPYRRIKEISNRAALRLLDEARAAVESSDDPFRTAVLFSIAGNIMDFALTAAVDRLDLSAFIEETLRQPLDEEELETFRAAARRARSVLVIGDNAGEIVFDRLLLEQLRPARLAYAVKSAPVINDATRADAETAGIGDLAEIIDTGSDAPGAPLDQCSPDFLRRFREADLVIAKGQANYETLSDAPREIFFLTRVKCPVIARDIGEPLGAWVIKRHAP